MEQKGKMANMAEEVRAKRTVEERKKDVEPYSLLPALSHG